MKVTILGGAGGVGASTAFNLALMRGAHEVVLVDDRPEHGHVARDGPRAGAGAGSRLHRARRRRRATWPTRTSSSCSRRRRSRVGTSRLEYLEKNAPIADELADRLAAGWAGLIVVVTNPVDPLVTRLQRANRFRPAPDPRLHDERQPAPADRPRQGARRAAGQRRGMGAGRARRHERAPVRPRQGRRRAGAPDARSRRRPPRSTSAPSTCGTSRSTRGARRPGRLGSASRAWSLRSTAPASCGRRRSCSTGSTASSGVAVSVPVTLGRAGAEQIHEWDLTPAQLKALHASAELVREAAVGIAAL